VNAYTRSQFGTTVRNDFTNRRTRNEIFDKSVQLSASAALETRALGHPDFEDLGVGERRTAPMVSVFLDLTNFTARTFWDDQDETVDLAHAVLSGFIEVVSKFGGHPLGLRGDGLFAGFSPGDPAFAATMALSACAFALDGVENEVNPWLDRRGMAHVQARAGLDHGPIAFVRTGDRQRSEINPLGFAANFAAKCEKAADSWEIVVGEGLSDLLPEYRYFAEHEKSPKRYTRDYQTETYRFFYYRWRNTLPHLPGVIESLAGTTTSRIYRR
jgi:adenylate cyclase